MKAIFIMVVVGALAAMACSPTSNRGYEIRYANASDGFHRIRLAECGIPIELTESHFRDNLEAIPCPGETEIEQMISFSEWKEENHK